MTEMKHNGKEIKIVFMQLPESVYGVTLDSNDGLIVFINNSASSIVQRHAIGHELAHIFLDHFSSNRQLRELEREANKAAWYYYRVFKEHLLNQHIGRAAQ